MNFTRKSHYHEVSDCGQYTVCAIFGKDGVRFEAWHGKEQLAVNLATAEEARDVCRQHKASGRVAA